LHITPQDNAPTDADFIQCMLHVVLPMAHQFQPDMVIVSAGFDAADGDFFGKCQSAGL
jgi:histone deacetylase 6